MLFRVRTHNWAKIEAIKMYIWDVGNKDNEFGVLITNALHSFPRFLSTFAGKAEVGEKEKDNLLSPSLSHNRQSVEKPNWPLIG